MGFIACVIYVSLSPPMRCNFNANCFCFGANTTDGLRDAKRWLDVRKHVMKLHLWIFTPFDTRPFFFSFFLSIERSFEVNPRLVFFSGVSRSVLFSRSAFISSNDFFIRFNRTRFSNSKLYSLYSLELISDPLFVFLSLVLNFTKLYYILLSQETFVKNVYHTFGRI